MKDPKTMDDYIDHILEYDPEEISTAMKLSTVQPEMMLPRNLTPIPWPDGKAPQPQPFANKPDPEAVLPQCDYLVVTWTVAEAMALSDVLTPGHRSKTD